MTPPTPPGSHPDSDCLSGFRDNLTGACLSTGVPGTCRPTHGYGDEIYSDSMHTYTWSYTQCRYEITGPSPTPTPAPAPDTTPLNTYELRINFYNLGWGTANALESVVMSIANAVNPLIVPLGYNFKNQYKLDTANNTLSLYYEGHSPAIPVAAIIAAIIAILIGVGFVITSISWLKEASALQTATQTKSDAITSLTDSYNAGKISATDYTKALTALQKVSELPGDPNVKPTDWTTIAEVIAVAIIIMALLQSGLLGGKK